MAVIVESMEGVVLTFTVTPDGPSRGPGVPNMASNEIGGPGRDELFTAEWGELVALYRLATSDGRALAEIRLRHEARRQLAERMKHNGIAHSLNFLLTLDPLTAFDALAPKALLGPPPDVRFGPMVTAENAADLDATAARYRVEALRRGGVDSSFLQRTIAPPYTKPSLA